MKYVHLNTLKFLEQMPQIKRLSLIMTRIDDHSYLPISKLPNLTNLTLPVDKDLDKDIDKFQKWLQ